MYTLLVWHQWCTCVAQRRVKTEHEQQQVQNVCISTLHISTVVAMKQKKAEITSTEVHF